MFVVPYDELKKVSQIIINSLLITVFLRNILLKIYLFRCCVYVKYVDALASNLKGHQYKSLDSPQHVFISSWKDSLPSLPVLFAVFYQVLQIRALIYKDAAAIVAL